MKPPPAMMPRSPVRCIAVLCSFLLLWGCSNGNPSPAGQVPVEPAHSGPYGAIAVAADGEHAGLSYDEASREDAEAAAVRSCERGGKGGSLDCRSQLWFKDACGAVAMGDNGGYGTGWGDTPPRACREALTRCRGAQARNCEANFYVCSPGERQGTCDASFTRQR